MAHAQLKAITPKLFELNVQTVSNAKKILRIGSILREHGFLKTEAQMYAVNEIIKVNKKYRAQNRDR